MKILWYNWKDIKNPRAGGAEVFTHEVAKRLAGLGHEITIFASAFRGSDKFEELDKVRIIRAGGKYSVYLKGYQYYRKYFSKENYDLVIEGINTIPFLTPIYVKERKISLIYQITGEVFSRIFPRVLAIPARNIELIMYKLVYKRHEALVISNSVKIEVVRLGFEQSNVNIAEPGIDHEYYRPGTKSEYPSIIYLNRVVPYKNVDHAIESFNKVKLALPKARLFIVGCRGSKYETSLRRLANRLNLADSLEFLGFVPDEEKRRLLQMAWVHIIPSTKEGWGISVIEAAACGTPTVGYDVVGLRDSVRNMETGLLVPFDDIEGLADSLIELLTSINLRDGLSSNARDWSTKFSWERTTNLVLKALSANSQNGRPPIRESTSQE